MNLLAARREEKLYRERVARAIDYEFPGAVPVFKESVWRAVLRRLRRKR